MRLEEIKTEVEIPEGVQITQNGIELTVKGSRGELKRIFENPRVEIKIEGNKVLISRSKPSRRDKAIIFTYRTHIRNMIEGVTNGFKYELKVCSTHFPMNVAFNNGTLTVKNFYGEKAARTLVVDANVKVNVKDKIIELESNNKETAGMVASNIEQMTRITNRDRRIFQDGIFIISKSGKAIK